MFINDYCWLPIVKQVIIADDQLLYLIIADLFLLSIANYYYY